MDTKATATLINGWKIKGWLTTDHAASSYGQPVFVDNDRQAVDWASIVDVSTAPALGSIRSERKAADSRESGGGETMTHLIGIVAYVTAALALVVLSGIVLGNDITAAVVAALLLVLAVAVLALWPRRPRYEARYSRPDDAIWSDTRWQVTPVQDGEWTAIDEGETALVVREP